MQEKGEGIRGVRCGNLFRREEMKVLLNDETHEMNGEPTVGALLDEIELSDLGGLGGGGERTCDRPRRGD